MPELSNRIKFTSKGEIQSFIAQILHDMQSAQESAEREIAAIEKEH